MKINSFLPITPKVWNKWISVYFSGGDQEYDSSVLLGGFRIGDVDHS